MLSALYADSRIIFIMMLSATLLNVILLTVAAPFCKSRCDGYKVFFNFSKADYNLWQSTCIETLDEEILRKGPLL